MMHADIFTCIILTNICRFFYAVKDTTSTSTHSTKVFYKNVNR